MVAGEDQVVVGVQADEVRHRPAHRVGRALEPVGVLGRLLGRDDVDERLREVIEPVGLADVSVERRGVELRQHEDPADAGVQAVADRDVDEAVLAANRHCGLRAPVGEGVEALALAATQDDRQYICHARVSSVIPAPSTRPGVWVRLSSFLAIAVNLRRRAFIRVSRHDPAAPGVPVVAARDRARPRGRDARTWRDACRRASTETVHARRLDHMT